MNMKRLDRFAVTIRTLAGIMLVVVAFGMIATIAGRYLGFPSAWADELARLAFVWSATLGAASALHHGAHFMVSLVPANIGAASRRLIETAIAVTIIGLCAMLLWATTQSIPVAANARLPALGISGAWFHAAITTFTVLAMIFVGARLTLLWSRPAGTAHAG